MTPPLDRRIPLQSAAILRDLGGLAAGDGAVRPGAIYRSATLARLHGDDVAAFGHLARDGLGLGSDQLDDLRQRFVDGACAAGGSRD